MILETHRSLPAELRQEPGVQARLRHLWLELGTETQKLLALSWAKLIVHMRQLTAVEADDDRRAPR